MTSFELLPNPLRRLVGEYFKEQTYFSRTEDEELEYVEFFRFTSVSDRGVFTVKYLMDNLRYYVENPRLSLIPG